MAQQMSPSQLRALLSATIPAKLPVLITGAPGIGKTDIVIDESKAAQNDIIVSHPVVADPTDAKGLPWVSEGAEHASFLPFGELHQAIHATRPTVWFLDDLGQGSNAVQASFMQLILARRINGHKISDHVVFIAATNGRQHRAGVSGILEPVKSRFKTIIELVVSIDDWSKWAIANNIPVELIAFLRMRPDLLHDFNATADIVNSPSPRTWNNLADLQKLNLPAHIEAATYSGSVGEGAATEYLAFLKMYRQMPSIDGILTAPSSAIIPTEASALYAVSTALAYKANENNLGRIFEYLARLNAKGNAEFSALTIRDALQRKPELSHSHEYIKAMSGEFGSIISGN